MPFTRCSQHSNGLLWDYPVQILPHGLSIRKIAHFLILPKIFCIILFYCIHNKKFAKIISDCRAQFSSILKNLCLALNMNQICKDIQGQTFKAQSRPMYVSIEALHSIVHKQVLELAHPKWAKPNFCTQTRLCVHFLYFPPYSVKKKKSRIEGFSNISKSVFCIRYKALYVTDVRTEHLGNTMFKMEHSTGKQMPDFLMLEIFFQVKLFLRGQFKITSCFYLGIQQQIKYYQPNFWSIHNCTVKVWSLLSQALLAFQTECLVLLSCFPGKLQSGLMQAKAICTPFLPC